MSDLVTFKFEFPISIASHVDEYTKEISTDDLAKAKELVLNNLNEGGIVQKDGATEGDVLQGDVLQGDVLEGDVLSNLSSRGNPITIAINQITSM